MGWKNVKEHYGIDHIVHVVDGQLCIGSPYIPDIIVIDQDGTISQRYKGTARNLVRYQQEMEADPNKLRRLMESPDHFDESITVYTYDGGEIIEKQCETPGWPNVTHDGELMHDNTFSTDRNQVELWATENARATVDFLSRSINETELELARLDDERIKARVDLEKLLAGTNQQT